MMDAEILRVSELGMTTKKLKYLDLPIEERYSRRYRDMDRV